MFSLSKRILGAVALVGLAASLCAAAPGGSLVRHREKAAGTVTALEPTTLHFAGTGRATHFGRYSIVGSNDFDELGNVLNGEFTTTAADGATISGIYAGTYTPLADGSVRFDVNVQWLVGTGRLEGIVGQASVVAILDGLAPGAAFEYLTDGFLLMP